MSLLDVEIYGIGRCLASIENIYDDYWTKNWLILSHFLFCYVLGYYLNSKIE